MNSAKRALVVGGQGSLGKAVLAAFNSSPSWSTVSFDKPNLTTDVKTPTDSIEEFMTKPSSLNTPSEHVLAAELHQTWPGFVESTINQLKSKDLTFDCVVHTAGGFVGGDLNADMQVFEDNWRMNVRSAYFSAYLAQKFLKPSVPSLLVLSGAKGAMESGPAYAISYGMCKAATHHLAKSASNEINTVCILPTVLDTPNNRAAMPDEDFSTWSDINLLAGKIKSWAEDPSKVESELFIDV